MSNFYDHEFDEDTILDYDRRSFLKIAGFTFAGSLLAGCKGPVEKAIPFLIQPEEITPGVPYWYSSMCGGCPAGCGILVKCRDGRPIKLEGNPEHPFSKGGLCAIGQAQVLSLYDSRRLSNPLYLGNPISFEALDENLKKEFEKLKKEKGKIRILTKTISSPTTRKIIRRFLSDFSGAKHIEFDPLSYSTILDAHAITHNVRMMPRYRFDDAQVIVSFDADFLGTWVSPVEFNKAYRSGRRLDGQNSHFSYHVQLESRVSLTGSNADRRIVAGPIEIRLIAERLLNRLSTSRVSESRIPLGSEKFIEESVKHITDRLLSAKGKSIVVCGVNDLSLQIIVNAINAALDNYGKTIDTTSVSNQYRGNDTEVETLLHEIENGDVSALIVDSCDPFYSIPHSPDFAAKLKKIPLVISFSEYLDETSQYVTYISPQPHELECWYDVEVVGGLVSVMQPVIQSFRNVRTMTESFSAWLGTKSTSYDLIREEWKQSIFKRQSKEKIFEKFWNKTLSDGFSVISPESSNQKPFNKNSLSSVLGFTTKSTSEFICITHGSLTMYDGRHAHNPWLHELPDPITKIVWDNYVSIGPQTAKSLGVENGDIVSIKKKNSSLDIPVFVQIGHHEGIFSISLGYGKSGTDRFTTIGPDWIQSQPTVRKGETVGKNVVPMMEFCNGALSYYIDGVSISKTGQKISFALSQQYDFLKNPSMMGMIAKEKRPIVQQADLQEYMKDPLAGSFKKHKIYSMWPDDHQYDGHHWGMTIDLSACTGCSACVISCVAENNIPVVGKDEVRRNRELPWIRIDRYYDEHNGTLEVSHQPMLCQHCGNAPCETVCPVLATVHDSEGLNQQVYNRCVGTRYCANNCPYKVRHFNWFQYSHGDETNRMVLNPDVTVRDRGVMEKCTFCTQRIHLAKIEAKNNGRQLKDKDIQTACQQSCPADAIEFGDMNDPDSKISQRMKDPRYYRVLEELGVKPSVGYMTEVKNRTKEVSEAKHA